MKPEAEKALKLLTLGLDDAAHDGEAENSAVLAIRLMRKHKIKLTDLGVPRTVVREVEKTYTPWWHSVEIRFGKHKGRTIGELADEEPTYLLWLAENVTLSGNLAKAVAHALEAIEA